MVNGYITVTDLVCFIGKHSPLWTLEQNCILCVMIPSQSLLDNQRYDQTAPHRCPALLPLISHKSANEP